MLATRAPPTAAPPDTTPTGTGNTITDSVTMPAHSSIVYSVTGTVTIPLSTNLPITSISNTATVSAGGTTTTATDNDNLINLAITKSDNSTTPGSVTPDQPLTYTVVVSNAGPGIANGVAISDPVPANFINDTWTATFSGGATDTAVGSTGMGNISDTGTLPAGSSITYTVIGTVSPSASGGSTLTNTATATPPGGIPVTATDNDTVVIPVLTVTKTDNSSTPGIINAGQTLTYTIVVTNTGPGVAHGVVIADPMLTTILTGDTWTATTAGSATGFSATGSGNIDDTNVTMPVGSTITYLVTGTVISTATGTLSNTATATVAGTPVSATDPNTVGVPVLAITKSDDSGGISSPSTVGNVSAGQPLTSLSRLATLARALPTGSQSPIQCSPPT